MVKGLTALYLPSRRTPDWRHQPPTVLDNPVSKELVLPPIQDAMIAGVWIIMQQIARCAGRQAKRLRPCGDMEERAPTREARAPTENPADGKEVRAPTETITMVE